ncbi:T-complex protein 1 subunit gamma-like [Pteropus vampyrus]|uniref:T-complex protein 1 subunit gamma-like n=1 Tax=Pteropus vampyrus TaxID=132908 RepID=A0A6P6CT53_PTEVA|nr:T-complex protein 1 subunit gamma-like [Pteropus vampyrus]
MSCAGLVISHWLVSIERALGILLTSKHGVTRSCEPEHFRRVCSHPTARRGGIISNYAETVTSQNTKRESGRKVQSGNINAAKTIADIIRTCLGPKSMMKMLLDPMGGIVMTNDGNAILREV